MSTHNMFFFLCREVRKISLLFFSFFFVKKVPNLELWYEGMSINNQPIPFPMDRDGHDFHALFQYMFYTWVQNCTHIESFFNKILNVKHG